MHRYRFLSFVLLMSLLLASAFNAVPTSAARPVALSGPAPCIAAQPAQGTEQPTAQPAQGTEQPTAQVVAEPSACQDVQPTDDSAALTSDAAESLPNDPSANWLDGVQEDIREAEYQVTWQDRTVLPDLPAAYQAPNRAHNLRTYFTSQGIRVIPRTDAIPTWEWSLRLRGYGDENYIQPATATDLAPSGQRVEYRRGDLVEWYVNDARGIEQGFTLAARPAGVASETLDIDLALSGSLVPTESDDGAAIDFNTREGVRVLRYSDLYASDATGRSLPAHMRLVPPTSTTDATGPTEYTIRLHIEASAAVYPITIDPLASTPSWSAEGNQVSAAFGFALGTAGDVNGDGFSDVIVGALRYDNGQTDEGRVFVYHGSAMGLSASPIWTAEGNQAGAAFGRSVGTAGDVNGDGFSDVIIGANGFDNGQTDEGRVFVYHGSATGLSSSANWSAESNQVSAAFGHSVGTAGDVNGDGFSDVIVGALSYDNGQTDEGRAFVYHGSATGLSASPNWSVESNQTGAFLSGSVGTAGDVNGDGYADVIVGASSYTNGQTNEGRAFVYHGSTTGLSSSANWSAESNQAGAGFGASVNTAGDVNGDGYADVIVGAPLYDNGQTNEGRVVVYRGSAAGLNTSPIWTKESDQAGAEFGRSVSTAGDVNGDGYADVIIGAPIYDRGQTDEGRAFVYHGSAANLSTGSDWSAESNQASARFAEAVGTAGDVNGDGFADVIVGGSSYDNGQADEGRAFVYRGSAASLSASANWSAEGNQVGSRFGLSVSTAGDVNGDGFADVIVGASFYSNGQASEGRVLVYFGSATGLSTIAGWTAESNQAAAYFGWSVGTAGDVNGDGYADVIIGAPFYSNGQNREGRVFVYHGSATGLSISANWTAESNQAEALFGGSLGTAGDVNGDGYADIIIGASGFDNGQTDEGRAFVYLGSATGLTASANWTAESNQTDARFGASVGTAGDVNGDSYADVIVGAPYYDNGQEDEGRVFVYHGSTSGLSTAPNWTVEGNQNFAWFGDSVNTAGDVNSDAYADVIVGAPYYDNGQTNEGRVFVYHGSTAGLNASPSWTAEGNQVDVEFGAAVRTAGDVNSDGFADIVIGAGLYVPECADDVGCPLTPRGRASVYHGSAIGLSTSAGWTAEGDQDHSNFGTSISTTGDINGDGYADIIVGAPHTENGQYNEGRAFVYYGNGGRGLSLNPRQRRSDNSAPIAQLGRSDSASQFRLAARGRTPFGRGLVKVEWEVKRLGSPFTGRGTVQTSAWINTGTAGVEINRLVGGLTSATGYHWRVRLRYHPASSPFQQYSRWITMPWNGWNEQDLRTP